MITKYLHVPLELWGAIFCLITSFCIYISKDVLEKGNQKLLLLHLSNVVLLVADVFAWSFRGYPGEKGRNIVYISNFIVFVMGYVMMAFFCEYLVYYIGQDTKWKRIWRKAIWLLTITSSALVIISQYNHMFYYFDAKNFYHRNNLFYLTQVFGLIGSFICAVVLVQNRKRLGKVRFWTFMSYILLPFVAMLIQISFYGISLLNIAITISILLMFIVLQLERSRKIKEQAKQLVLQQNNLNEMQRKIMMSQIQPHFLYNSLNTIYHLCDIDTEIAQKAISDFSDYLRGNLDSLKRSHPVTFDTELKHVQTYLELEKLRFYDELEVEYDIQETGFTLPALSLQPLVENAVKYGVGKAKNGGKVIIATRKCKDCFEITVKDNGVGFDPTEVKDDGRSHIGIDNVRQRLQMMCRATLEINTELGVGTKVTICVPMGEKIDINE